MKTFFEPSDATWRTITQRPNAEKSDVEAVVTRILQEVKARGDEALQEFSKQYDNASLDTFWVTEKEITEAKEKISSALYESMLYAAENIKKFHASQLPTRLDVETRKGVVCTRKSVPIEKVGLYIPGGSAPLFSTVLMLGIPAMLAGCGDIILCSPPNREGTIHPAILVAAHLCGIKKVAKIGGAHAIAAMAFGTASFPSVYKIFGPGNSFVMRAKQLVSTHTAIDMPAGPSEVLVWADKHATPAFIAADLLAQAEHGADSQVVLITEEKKVVEDVLLELDKQVSALPRKDIAVQALAQSSAVLLSSLEKQISFIQAYAPEHLIIQREDADACAEKITNAGSIFIGAYTPESAGDYASGTNHTLPTNGFAKAWSGVSVDSFMKTVTLQKITKEGLQELGKHVERMAEAEGLQAHKNSITIRLNTR